MLLGAAGDRSGRLGDGRDSWPRRDVDLAAFECRDITRSTVLQRVCYDRTQRDLIVVVRGNYERELPGVPAVKKKKNEKRETDAVEQLMAARSMGQYFNRNIGAARAQANDWPRVVLSTA